MHPAWRWARSAFGNVGVERLRVSEFLHPCILNNGEDELRSLLPLRLIGVAVGALGLVRHFRARVDDGSGIVIDLHIVGSNACWFRKLRVILHCIHCHQTNEAYEVVCDPCFVVRDLEEDRRQDLPDSLCSARRSRSW